MTSPDRNGLHRVTFELEGHMTALTLWHTSIPRVGENVLLAHSRWTVIRIKHEVIERDGKFITLTRYVIDDEQPA